MQDRIVVIGTSAGGIEALRVIAGALPADFPAPIAIVMHQAPASPGILPEILSRAGLLPAARVTSGEPLRPGHIYVPPPDYHLLVEPGRLRLTRGPKENGFRPAVDPLFRTAAQVYGPAAIGVILTGSLDDGTAGLWAVKKLGGTTVVQDPADALFPGMPDSAVRHVEVDHRVTLPEIAPLLTRLTAAPVVDTGQSEVPEHMAIDIKIAQEQNPLQAGLGNVAQPSPIACPECHGVLMQLKEAGRIRFRCHTGHGYSAESLLAEINDGIEDALWNAIRSLQEGGILMQELAGHVDAAHPDAGAASLHERAEALRRHADALRAIVTTGSGFTAKT
jgi:two-component system, chemotaxis family, protein-glutamate methylesterase/glutaminase